MENIKMGKKQSLPSRSPQSNRADNMEASMYQEITERSTQLDPHKFTMINRCILYLALLLLFSANISSKAYDSLRFHQRRTNHRSLMLLDKMIGKLHSECLQERMDFQIPQEIVKPQQYQRENVTMVILEMLQQTFLLFSSKNASPDVNKTIIETFLSGIYQQMVHLEMALEEEMDQADSFWESNESILHLKNYYQRITNFLKNKKYSSCAWKVVQVEIKRNFLFLYKLTEYLKN
ncbi:interferon beta-like [Gracilinanus agilis]|uniref:interferon beta-like n=1 Tax=Gracilinanus agilis TaxID=191870 RepID=UPI001CFF508B|nr:interferon beta-like [Gracilinanus agilis]